MGLDGLHRTSTFVRGVIAASRSAGIRQYPSLARVEMTLVSAPLMYAISVYETQ